MYSTTGKEAHLLWAIQLQEKMDELFEDKQNGGYWASEEDELVLVRMKESQVNRNLTCHIDIHKLTRQAIINLSNRMAPSQLHLRSPFIICLPWRITARTAIRSTETRRRGSSRVMKRCSNKHPSSLPPLSPEGMTLSGACVR